MNPNERLQHYYLRQDFTYVRTCRIIPLGCCARRPAQHILTPRICETKAAQ